MLIHKQSSIYAIGFLGTVAESERGASSVGVYMSVQLITQYLAE